MRAGATHLMTVAAAEFLAAMTRGLCPAASFGVSVGKTVTKTTKY